MSAVPALGLLAFVGFTLTQASPIQPTHGNADCSSFNIPVPITAQTHLFNVIHVDSSIDATRYAIDFDTWDSPTVAERVIDNITISRTYNIHANLCVPRNGAKKNLLQVATHGGAFDSRYWDSDVEPEKYSYVKAVLDKGYSILTYDRISTGQSSKPNAYTDVQIPAEVEVLRGITEQIRSGQIWDCAATHQSQANTTFDKIIHVGHSLGSFISYGLTALYPDLSDAVVLTGFLANKEAFNSRMTARGLEYGPQNDPVLFADCRSGYIVPGTEYALQSGFFSARRNETAGLGGFDPKLLDHAFATRQPEGVVERSSGDILYQTTPIAPQYTGPVQFMVGEIDFVACLGDCRDTYNATMVNGMYPMAKAVDIYLQPGTGHALPLHYGAQTGFQATFDWLEKNGI